EGWELTKTRHVTPLRANIDNKLSIFRQQCLVRETLLAFRCGSLRSGDRWEWDSALRHLAPGAGPRPAVVAALCRAVPVKPSSPASLPVRLHNAGSSRSVVPFVSRVAFSDHRPRAGSRISIQCPG